MAMTKYANASVIHQAVSKTEWANIRVAGKGIRIASGVNDNLIERASEMLQTPFNPNDYLLTHATIVASVDTYTPADSKTGSMLVEGFRVNRKFSDYRVTTDTNKYINNNCFIPGTPVTMGDGTVKPIEDIQVGDVVLTHKGRARKVVETFQHDVDGLLYEVKVRGTSERLYVTQDHPFFVFRSNKQCVECGKEIQHKVQAISHLLGKHYCSKECYYRKKICNQELLSMKTGEFTPVKELGYGDFAATPVIQDVVPVELTLGQARLIGLFLAEGYYELDSRHENERVGVVWAFHQKERNTLAKTVCDLMMSEFSADCVIRDCSGTLGINVSSRVNREAVAFFSRWVLGEGSTTKTLASELIRAPKDIQMEILRGWLDGDGSGFDTALDDAPGDFRVVGSTASQKLASQMMLIFHRLGVYPRLCHSEQPGRQRVVIDGVPRVIPNTDKACHGWHLSCGAAWVQELVETTRFEEAYHQAMYNRGGCVQNATTLRCLNDYVLQAITDVTPVEYTGKVYNFETEEDHSYLAGGFAVHNSDAWSRGVLVKAYPTFIGGHNFLEHVQIEDLSKGRIIDAVARDVKDSIYVDILIATNKKHTDLVASIQNGEMATLSMGCFLPGTQVSLSDGRRIAIEDVQPGDFVLTHRGRAREVLNKQIRGGLFGIRQIRAVGVPTTINATDNHPFFVIRQPDTCACGCGEALTPYKNRTDASRGLTRRFLTGHDKRIYNPNNDYSVEEDQRRKSELDQIYAEAGCWVRADELRVGDFLCFPKVSDESDAPVSNGKARLLGYFLAEGSFLKYNGEPIETQFSFSLTEKDTFVAEVVTLLKQEFDLDNEPWVQDRLDRNTCTVHVSGRSVAEWFQTHGGEYSNHKKISPEAMCWSVENHKHLIGAWLNGDGHLSKIGQTTSGVTTSYDLACQIHLLMARCGVYARLECRVGNKSVDTKDVIGNGFTRDKASGRLPTFTVIAGKGRTTSLIGYTDKVTSKVSIQNRNTRVRDDMMIFPITSIKTASYEGWVHNMEVAEDNSYIVEGVASHNCVVDGTICSKCGHWAADETEMCPHIKYMKGNTFFDEQGHRHRISELCGHETLDPTGGVTFIEASWVRSPAFTGAVLRNVIEPTEEQVKQAAQVLTSLPPQWASEASIKTAAGVVIPKAFSKTSILDVSDEAFLAGWEDDSGDDASMPDAEKAAPATEADPISNIVKNLEEYAAKQVEQRIREKMQNKPTEQLGDSSLNETVMKQASYKAGLDVLVRTASSDIALVDALAEFNNKLGIDIPVGVYRAALRVGSTSAYTSAEDFRLACDKALGRRTTLAEAKTIIRIGKLLARRLAANQYFNDGSRQ